MGRSERIDSERIEEIFRDEIASGGGTVTEVVGHGDRLFARSIMPWAREVRPRDRVQGGVAMRAIGTEVWIHPYVFRLICKNGAIRAHALESLRVRDLDWLGTGKAESKLREAIRACCQEEVFEDGVQEMRDASKSSIDSSLEILPFLARMRTQGRVGSDVVTQIMAGIAAERDTSLFGLMNVVTAVARDTADPDVRWRLEELGGGIAAARVANPVRSGPAARSLIDAMAEAEDDFGGVELMAAGRAG